MLLFKLVGVLWEFPMTSEAVLLDPLQLPGSFLDGASSPGHRSAQQIRASLVEWNLCGVKLLRCYCNTRSQKFLYGWWKIKHCGIISGRHA